MLMTIRIGCQTMQSEIDRILQQANSLPVNIEAIARGLGLAVVRNATLADGISGQIKRLPNGRFEVASSNREHHFRQRFTLAHELGHYLLHRSLIGEGIDDDTKYRSTDTGEFYNTDIDLAHERQANSFAAKVLMPEGLLRAEVEKARDAEGKVDVGALCGKFQVSRSAMEWRLKNLGLLPR